MFTTALFTVAKKGNSPNLQDNEWINSMWYIQTKEYLQPLKDRKRCLSLTATWMNPKDIPLSEISPSQKDKYCMIPFIGGIKRSEIHRNTIRMMLDQGLGRRKKTGNSV